MRGSTVATALGVFAGVSILIASGCADPDPALGPRAGAGQVRLALGADSLADHCVNSVFVNAWEELDDPDESCAISRERADGTRGCYVAKGRTTGSDPVFLIESLIAGHRYFVSAELSTARGVAYEGESDWFTVVAGAQIDVAVPLIADRLPQLVSVSPDPVVVGDAAVSLVLRGAGFGVGFGQSGPGAAGIELDGAALTVRGWNDENVTASLPPGLSGQALSLRSCGLSSEPLPLRVVAVEAPGRVELPQGTGCEVVAAARASDGALWVANSCALTAQGNIERLSPEADACPLERGQTWLVGGSPRSVSVAEQAVWVAVEGAPTLTKIDLVSGERGEPVSLPAGSSAEAVAAMSGARIFAIASTGDGGTLLVQADEGQGEALPVPDIGEDLSLFELAAVGDEVYVTAIDEGGAGGGEGGKLVSVSRDGLTVTRRTLTGCAAPGPLATGADGWVVVGCGDKVLALSTVDQRVRTLTLQAGASVGALELDGRGDVALIGDRYEGSLSLMALGSADDPTSEPSLLAAWGPAWARGVRSLRRYGAGHDFLAATTSGLEVWTPYRPEGPCAAVSE